MNSAQIHLALNHAPLFLSIIGGGLLVLGIIRKSELLKTISLWLLVTAALFTLPVFFTGEGTEELVEELPGVNEALIERHEEMAKIALIVICAAGAVSLAGLLLRKKAAGKFIMIICVILSLASFGTIAQTAHLGGLIRHSEIQNGSAPADSNGESREDKDDDD